MALDDGRVSENWGFKGYEAALAFPPAVCVVHAPECVVRWARASMAGLIVKVLREKKDNVKEYLGSGRSWWATTMVSGVDGDISSRASVCGESTNAPRWRASSLR